MYLCWQILQVVELREVVFLLGYTSSVEPALSDILVDLAKAGPFFLVLWVLSSSCLPRSL